AGRMSVNSDLARIVPTFCEMPLRTKTASGEKPARPRCVGEGGFEVCTPVTGGAATGSVEQGGIRAAGLLPERREAEPARQRIARLLPRVRSHLVVDVVRFAGRHGEQLRLATALHRDEPEGGFVDRFAHREQTVVAVDRGLARRELR